MIGWPTQTPDGVVVTSFINPALRPNVKVKINTASIIQAERDNTPLGEAGGRNFDIDNTGRLAADGVYTVLYMERRGDTRGADWFDVSTCIASDASPNKSQIAAGFSLGNA